MKKKTSEETRIVIIPDYNEIPVGTLQSIIRQSGFTLEEFIKLF
jgi:predicted RNA binding protein YcfA (HicA-like mRNA interferase family)